MYIFAKVGEVDNADEKAQKFFEKQRSTFGWK
jgi:hypothetical protein